MFSFFERLIDPYRSIPLAPPPAGLWAFFWHYIRPVWPIVATISVLTAMIAALEIVMLGYVGYFVDLMTNADRATFLEVHGGEVGRMALLALVVLPLLAVSWEFVFHQSFAGNFPMMIRWQGHRYMLRQSLAFFQDDFAGRLANTLMQTALAVRDSVERVINTIVYAIVYVASALVVLAAADWRLAIPLAVWIASYVAAGAYFMPRLARLSQAQADARSVIADVMRALGSMARMEVMLRQEGRTVSSQKQVEIDNRRIRARQHGRQAEVGLAADGVGHGGRGMAEHGARVAEAEIDVGVPVGIRE